MMMANVPHREMPTDSIGTATQYQQKAPRYFSAARADYVAEIPPGPNRILEIGCADGMTGLLAKQQGKAAFYCGVELFPDAARNAKERIDEIVVGDIEKIDRLPWPENFFDFLITSEVLEHLVDPLRVLTRLRSYLRPGGRVFASSPNVSHYRTIAMLLKGDWRLTEMGVMDRTHLRWFTPKTYVELFRDAGYTVERVQAVSPLAKKAKIANLLTLGKLKHLFVVQIDIRATK
jgi:2-polyprenyl-3-methyl-5-hydroxy-6-metoxy-1,4-benzoquinol methylase